MRSVYLPPWRALATIDTAALASNYRLLLQRAQGADGSTQIMAVVKANAYGHGVARVLPTLLNEGCRHFAVATLQEALEVRHLCKEAEILIFGYTPPTRLPLLAREQLTQSVFSREYGRALARVASNAGCRIKVHLKLDGGLCRAGLEPDPASLARFYRQLRRHLDVTGLFTHFPAADTDPKGTALALARFLQCRPALSAPEAPLFCHAAASAAALTLPSCGLNGIRPGLALYGISPVKTDLPLRPVMALYAPVVQLRRVPKGTPVGYGGNFVTKRQSLIGTLPIGYADGVFRCLSGFCVTLLHKGKRFSAPIVGRISMDSLTVDLTDTPAQLGDSVCLWQSAAPPAAYAKTIPYELLTALSQRVRRVTR